MIKRKMKRQLIIINKIKMKINRTYVIDDMNDDNQKNNNDNAI